MSKLKFLNVFIFQLFFFRLTKHVEMDISNTKPLVDKNGEYIIDYWSLQYWIVPFTGWGKPYIFLTKDRKPKFFKL